MPRLGLDETLLHPVASGEQRDPARIQTRFLGSKKEEKAFLLDGAGQRPESQ